LTLEEDLKAALQASLLALEPLAVAEGGPKDVLVEARALISGRVHTRDGQAKVWATIEKRNSKDALRFSACLKFQELGSSVQQLASATLDHSPGTDDQLLNLARGFKALVDLAASLPADQASQRIWWSLVPLVKEWSASSI
jgi:hypothetical protein